MFWSQKEEDILVNNYNKYGPGGIFKKNLLPGRTYKAIKKKAEDLRLKVIPAWKEEMSSISEEQTKFDAITLMEQKVLNFLKGKRRSILEVCEHIDKSPTTVKQILKTLSDSHYNVNVHDDEDSVILHENAPSGNTIKFDIDKYFGSAREVTFGVISDLHYGNIHSRHEIIEHAYDNFKKEGVPIVLEPGNMVDGEAPFNKYELLAWGIQGQAEYLVKHAPQREGVTTYFITGEDHEGWLAKRSGLNIGAYFQNVFEEAGRYDWQYLSNLEADVAFQTKTGATVVRIAHPGGGTSYATSYQPQKIIESLQGGEKPHVFVCGHYHKLGYWSVRNVHTILAGCCEDQTPFARKKHLDFQLGYWIINMKLKDDGSVLELTPRMYPFFDRKVYQVNVEFPMQGSEIVEKKNKLAKPSAIF